jgi:hypothetical protein
MDVSKETEKGLVQIQIVNYVNWESTIACIQSIREQTYDGYRLVVIENASPNDSLKRLREFDPTLSILISDNNVGWGGGLNLGFFNHNFDTNPEFYFTLNSDVVLEPNCLSRLIKTMKVNPNCAVVAPIIYNGLHSDRTNNMGFNLSYKYLIPLDFSKLTGNCKKWIAQKTRKVNWVSDTVALMRRSAICRVGGYDEQYFMYGQMTDMGYRLKQHGYDLIVNYDAVAYHTEKGSSGGKLSEFSLYYKFRNWIIFHRKHFRKGHLLYTLLWSIGVMFLHFVKAILHRNYEWGLSMSRGVRDGFACTLENKTGSSVKSK